jgi:hypothetical protein
MSRAENNLGILFLMITMEYNTWICMICGLEHDWDVFVLNWNFGNQTLDLWVVAETFKMVNHGLDICYYMFNMLSLMLEITWNMYGDC